MPHARRLTRLATTALPFAAAALAVTLANAPSAAATDGSVFTFPELGTVVVNGTVDNDVNFTVYRILDPTCTGTTFPGPNNSCVPQEATDTLVIPAGTYDHETFQLAQIPTCGATQQDVYEGAYQATVTASGTHDYLGGGILQLGRCASNSPPPSAPTTPTGGASINVGMTPMPQSSMPGKLSSTPVPAVNTPAATTPTPSTSSSVDSSSVSDDQPNGYTYATAQSGTGSQLASTGTDHTTALLVAGIGAIVVGGASLAAGRRSGRVH